MMGYITTFQSIIKGDKIDSESDRMVEVLYVPIKRVNQ